MSSIADEAHPVKVGVSDAYIIDRTIFCKTILCLYIFNLFVFPLVSQLPVFLLTPSSFLFSHCSRPPEDDLRVPQGGQEDG